MLYSNAIKRLQPIVSKAFKEIIIAAIKNQHNENDLLLVFLNGFVTERFKIGKIKYGPLSFGDGTEGLNDWSHYEFIHATRNTFTQPYKVPRSKYFDKKNTDGFYLRYHLITHMELMVYLKFWESDFNLKRLYNLTRLAKGQPYCWDLKLSSSTSRSNFIRNSIRNPIEKEAPNYFRLIKRIYYSQIRNAVAHSQYGLLGDHLSFSNYDPRNHHPLKSISLQAWELKFHLLMCFYNEFIKWRQLIMSWYERKAKDKHFGLLLKMYDKHYNLQEKAWLKYNRKENPWIWYNAWERHYLERFYIS